MNFRMKITLSLITVIGMLFSIGSTVMIHITFENAVKAEEQNSVDTHCILLKMMQMMEETEDHWLNEEKLVSILTTFSTQDMVDAISLLHEEEVVFQRGNSVILSENHSKELEEHHIDLTCVSTSEGETYLKSSERIMVGHDVYYLNLGRNIHYVYELRESQIQAFQKIFLLFFTFGFLFIWMLSAFFTKPIRVLEHKIMTLQESGERKDRFMGAFSHELKTPMTSIIGYADLLRTQKLTEEDQEDAVNYIFTEAKRLENMSFKMMDLFVADKNILEGRETNVRELICHVVDHLRPAYEKNKIRFNIEAEDGASYMDPDYIQTLLLNLLDNSRKAMPQGGTITIKGKMLEDGCQIEVEDQGKGIPEDSLAHLTEAFYRVDKARARDEGSAGLGLALCQKIVKIHGGSITFESKLGEGTKVIVILKGGPQHEKE